MTFCLQRKTERKAMTDLPAVPVEEQPTTSHLLVMLRNVEDQCQYLSTCAPTLPLTQHKPYVVIS